MLRDDDFHKELIFRSKVVSIIILLLCLILIANLYLLQIRYSKKYQLMSDKNRIKVLPLLPKRGRIFSADGIILANNEYTHRLIMDYCSKKIFQKNIDELKKYLYLSETDIENLENQRRKRIANITVKDKLSRDEYVKVAMNLFKCNGVYIFNIYSRNYTMPYEFSHLLGYVSKQSKEIQFLTGRTGIELLFNEELKGKIGNIQHEINSIGNKVRIIEKEEPVNGKDIILSTNAELQKYIYDLLVPYKVGACCVLDITGKVLALVSVPGYNINNMSNGPSPSEWKEWTTSIYKPLVDRYSSSTYPPGSVFKIIVAYAALKEKLISKEEKLLCLGGIKHDNHVFHCWNRNGHGWINITEALSKSCDCFFFELAKKLGIERLNKYAKEFGFGKKTGIELPNEKSGLIPSREWKFLRYGTNWYAYETMLAGIGQGSVLSTLIQTATMLGKIYSDNINYHPTILNNGINKNEVLHLNKYCSDIVKAGLKQVCLTGTASGSCRTNYGIAGKTGSSQVRSLKSGEAGMNQKLLEWKHRDHAFFVGAAPLDSPQYIVAVLIEHGGGGARVAAPIARKIFDKLILKSNEN